MKFLTVKFNSMKKHQEISSNQTNAAQANAITVAKNIVLPKQTCCMCGKKFEGYGNNASPVVEGCCCDDCNRNVVIPARILFYRRMNTIN